MPMPRKGFELVRLIECADAAMNMGVSMSKQFDVIVYFNGNVLICHYFLKINRLKNSLGQDCLITKGLFAKHWDLLVPVDQVLGICTDVKISPLLKMREKIRMAFKK
jgi:hypothetical protein